MTSLPPAGTVVRLTRQSGCPGSPTGEHQYDDDLPFEEDADLRAHLLDLPGSGSRSGDPCVWCLADKP